MTPVASTPRVVENQVFTLRFHAMRALKYLAAFILPLTTGVSFTMEGWLSFLPLLYAFVLIPVLEWISASDASNLTKAERELVQRDPLYDLVLYLTVPVQLVTLIWFITLMADPGSGEMTTRVGRILSMGLMCGVFGINVAHELGHRARSFDRVLARVMLLTSLYMHFYIEHNRGHHRNVGTPADGATARRGETVYRFWIRSVVQGFRSAWSIVARERHRKAKKIWTPQNEMVGYLFVELLLVGAVWLYGGWVALWPFLIAATLGILLLETVNYIEHYGLVRRKISAGRFEDVKHRHSWNSDFVLGRLVLFELTRHSDHHWDPGKHYEELDSITEASHLPAGYPAMMLLALVPPLWFRVMDRRLSG